MKSQAQAIVNSAVDANQARQLLREYLQHVILRQLFEQKVLGKWVFHGGTALRIIHGVNRYSEDLDFHLKVPGPEFSLESTIGVLTRNLELQGYRISDPEISKRVVQSVFIRFKNLLFDFGLSPQQSQKLSIKIEVDTNPPTGFTTNSELVNVYFPLNLVTHDLPTFLSGKLHAILQRAYTKGRDYFDLIFLLSRWKTLTPNIPYLQNALQQTNYQGPDINEHIWQTVIAEVITAADWKSIVSDVEPFLLSRADLQLVDKQVILNLLN